MKPQPLALPASGTAGFVRDLARRHGVTYRKTKADAPADAITCVADDDVRLDEIEGLMIALRRTGVLTADNFVPLQVRYLREKLGLRSI